MDNFFFIFGWDWILNLGLQEFMLAKQVPLLKYFSKTINNKSNHIQLKANKKEGARAKEDS
jgi:hypothetical protein